MAPAAVSSTRDGTATCEDERKTLIARASEVKGQFDDTERLARASGVLPGHWRKLLALHQLEVWGS
jgi:hypothetical protein